MVSAKHRRIQREKYMRVFENQMADRVEHSLENLQMGIFSLESELHKKKFKTRSVIFLPEENLGILGVIKQFHPFTLKYNVFGLQDKVSIYRGIPKDGKYFATLKLEFLDRIEGVNSNRMPEDINKIWKTMEQNMSEVQRKAVEEDPNFHNNRYFQMKVA